MKLNICLTLFFLLTVQAFAINVSIFQNVDYDRSYVNLSAVNESTITAMQNKVIEQIIQNDSSATIIQTNTDGLHWFFVINTSVEEIELVTSESDDIFIIDSDKHDEPVDLTVIEPEIIEEQKASEDEKELSLWQKIILFFRYIISF